MSPSGCSLPAGVRLVPIADLLDESHKVVILRRPSDLIPSADAFLTRNAHIAGLYGATYSIYSLKECAEEQVSALLKIIPDTPFETKGTPDEFVQLFEKKPGTLELIKAHLPPELVANIGQDYFCSQLVLDILLNSGLLKPDDAQSPTTPCSLFDLLVEKSWTEVQDTSYREVKTNWSKDYCDIAYRSAVNEIASYKSHLYMMGGLSANIERSQQNLEELKKLDDNLKAFSKSLEGTTELLIRLSQDKPV